jgi:hypothetical protein
MNILPEDYQQPVQSVLLAHPKQSFDSATFYVEYPKPQTELDEQGMSAETLDNNEPEYDDWDDYDYPYSDLINQVKPVKPSAYVPGTNPHQLREPLAEILRLSEREAANLPLKLFKGVRPPDEQPNEQTERKYIFRTQTANGLSKSHVNNMSFYSRADLVNYAKRIRGTYEHYEVLGGVNEAFFRDAMHQGGYVDRNVAGVVFFAPFKTRFADSVLCFMGLDKQPTAEFLDVVMRRVPAESVAPASVPRAFYEGKRRTYSKEERRRAKQLKQEHMEYLARRAANAAKVKSYRLLLDMGIDPLEKKDAPEPTTASVSSDTGFDDDFFEGIDDIN